MAARPSETPQLTDHRRHERRLKVTRRSSVVSTKRFLSLFGRNALFFEPKTEKRSFWRHSTSPRSLFFRVDLSLISGRYLAAVLRTVNVGAYNLLTRPFANHVSKLQLSIREGRWRVNRDILHKI